MSTTATPMIKRFCMRKQTMCEYANELGYCKVTACAYEWIIGCIKHDGFIKTDRFDKANQIILEALEPSGDLISREVYEDKVEYYETKIEYLEGELEKHQPRVGTSDLISRADAIDKLRKERNREDENIIPYEDSDIGVLVGLDKAIRIVQDVPSVSAEPKRGEWELYTTYEEVYDMFGDVTWAKKYKCSNCGFIHTTIENRSRYNYCPNCGAYMVKGESDD